MPKKERMTLGEFLYLVPDNQPVMLCIDCLEKHVVTGEAGAIGYVTSEDVNHMYVETVEAWTGKLKVEVKNYAEDA